MPVPAEPREFRLSDYQRFRYKSFALLCAFGVALTSILLLSDYLGAQPVEFSYGLAAFIVGLGLAGWSALLKADRPFARLSRHGLTLHDGLLNAWSSPWTGIYAVEAPGRWRADLRLAGQRLRRVPLTMFEREDRQAFVEAVRKWIYSSH